jgi:hypothetical protein
MEITINNFILKRLHQMVLSEHSSHTKKCAMGNIIKNT